MATEVASLFGTITLQDHFSGALSSAKTSLSGFGDHLKTIGDQISGFGQSLTIAMAPATAALAASTKEAVDFDSKITNIAAVMGLTKDQADALGQRLLAIGANSTAGPQAVADAFYDIAGGVQDASTHMAILQAAIKTSEAGQADLKGTTSALISIMNAYGFSANDAAHVSDVLTMTVNKGVGTMDQFAAAFPPVTAMASQLKVPIDEVGTAMAFITTQGKSASEASTELTGAMTAFLKPNTDMTAALDKMGFASGSAAVEQLGLQGAVSALKDAVGGSADAMSQAMGRQEAFQGALDLTKDSYASFSTSFQENTKNSTDAARNIQMDSAKAQFDLLGSGVSVLAITIGTVFLPILLSITNTYLKPIVEEITKWVAANPQLTGQILMIVGGLILLGPVLFIVGTAISAAGTAVTILSGAFAILTAPVTIVALALAALVAAIQFGYPGGFPQLLRDAANSALMLAGIFLGALTLAAMWVREQFEHLRTTVMQLVAIGLGLLLLAVQFVQNKFNELVETVKTVIHWFQTNLANAIDFVRTNVIQPTMEKVTEFIGVLAGIWEGIKAGVDAFVTGIQNAMDSVKTFIQPVVDLIGGIAGAIDSVLGKLNALGGLGGLGGALGGVVANHAGTQVSSPPGPTTGAFAGAKASAVGGQIFGGERTLVGEQGPEMLMLPRGTTGNIIPNHELSKMGGGYTINGLTIHANDAAGGRAAATAFEKRLRELSLARGN